LLGFGEPCLVACYKFEPGPKYTVVSTFKAPGENPDTNSIWSLAISPDYSTLIASTVELQIFSATVKLDVTQSDRRDCELVPFGERVHKGPVVDLSVCVWRPVFVTCGAADYTVRFWNYNSGKQELVKVFDTPPISVSIHPLGKINTHISIFTYK
jgi:WD40 repeat protein